MRSAEANKYWRDLYSSSKYSTYLESLELKDCMGYTGNITFHKGITIFCGLNGVGKSTIISCIKQALGVVDNSIITNEKGQGVNHAILVHNGCSKSITPNSSALDQGLEEHKIVYIDSNQSIELLKFWSEQKNLNEYLDQFEANNLSSNQLEEVSWLIGKDYAECKMIETDEESNYVSVYFEVLQRERYYTSVDMGLGEHLLMYMYYVLSNIENNSILIIEEPESFISVISQLKLMDYLAEISSKKRISIIMTTHSPYILSMIKDESIHIVGNVFGKMIIDSEDSVEEAKGHLGNINCYQNAKQATVFVEDYTARIFLETMLNEDAAYLKNIIDIVSVEGCEGISNRLSYNDCQYMSHRLIGVYDDDMKDKLDVERIKWPYLFMPIKDCVEKELLRFIEIETNIDAICNNTRINKRRLLLSLSKRAGEDYHDWFIDMCNDIEIAPNNFIRIFYNIWKINNYEIIESFINELYRFVND